jgi:hypothetical protein
LEWSKAREVAVFEDLTSHCTFWERMNAGRHPANCAAMGVVFAVGLGILGVVSAAMGEGSFFPLMLLVGVPNRLG